MSFDEALKKVHLDLLIKHRQYARARDEESRSRIFNLLDEIEWVYPQLKDTLNG